MHLVDGGSKRGRVDTAVPAAAHRGGHGGSLKRRSDCEDRQRSLMVLGCGLVAAGPPE